MQSFPNHQNCNKLEPRKLTGGLSVSLDINEGIHDTQSRTTILTMLILTIVLAIVFRSIRLGIVTMVPVEVILWQPLLMQSGDVNVNIFTSDDWNHRLRNRC